MICDDFVNDDEMMMVEVLVMAIAMATAFATVDLGILNAGNCKKIPQRAGSVQATGRRYGAARQLKRLYPAQKLEGRNPTLIASG